MVERLNGSDGLRIEVRGVVQGVGYRPWVYRLARALGVAGRVRNDGAGVTIEAFGDPATLASFRRRIESEAPPAGRIGHVRAHAVPAEDVSDFQIEPSRNDGARRVSIPADLATCAECRNEVLDPGDRRFGYAFTNCTHCGPRFTIARDVPYDRSATTMAAFGMCPECRSEYEDPSDRRFHAQPNACPRCGPRLRLFTAGGAVWTQDAIEKAAAALHEGAIVAVKGLGGYHLACDARSPSAVQALRDRKQRDEKPFAVMVEDLAAARELAVLDEQEARLLASSERPIVLVRRREGSGLAAEIAPGNPLLGVLLAYTPLHVLLLRASGGPLVMTSGNLSDEPMAARDDEACARLAAIADFFLAHDREIENRCDDSVARVIASRPTLLRRARGYVPRAIPLPRPVSRPILACGGQLKNAFCLAADDQAWLGPHVGDLDNASAVAAFEEQVERMQRFLAIDPEIVAHDLHPDYASTAYALRRANVRTVGVQHHHAHVVSALAEHGSVAEALGLVWDGTGYGDDGSAWGGELLHVFEGGYRRLATLRPLRLAGGDAAIRQVWRLALAALEEAFDGEPPVERFPLFDRVPPGDLDVVRQMLRKAVRSPLAHGAGRYFDALGALALARPRATYEGQVALEWNLCLEPGEERAYPFELATVGGLLEADLRPLMRSAALDVADGERPGVVSARFHNAMAEVAVALVERAAGECRRLPLVLSGGCFQNAQLVSGVLSRLDPTWRVLRHGEVPPGDGGIALGQALVADQVAGGA